jgi:hypothetical protein
VTLLTANGKMDFGGSFIQTSSYLQVCKMDNRNMNVTGHNCLETKQ